VNAAPVTGALLDARYRVGSPIATGGMSPVCTAVDMDAPSTAPVAVKIMDARFAGDPAFRRALRAGGPLGGPHRPIPPSSDVHDQARNCIDDRRLFLVMELVDGGTLRDALRARGALGVPGGVPAVMEQVLAGPAEAHRLGMVHRDVKPENALLISATRGRRRSRISGSAVAAARGRQPRGHDHGHSGAYLSLEQIAGEGGRHPQRRRPTGGHPALRAAHRTRRPTPGDTAISAGSTGTSPRRPGAVGGSRGTCRPNWTRSCGARDCPRPGTPRPADAAMLGERAATRRGAGGAALPVSARAVAEAGRRTAHGSRGGPRPATGTRTVKTRRPPPLPTGPSCRRAAAAVGWSVVATALVLVLALGIGLTAWWLGSGR
jgi:serine/threonine-protein kinase